MLDPEIAETLDVLNANFPPVQEMSGAEARAAVAQRRQPVENLHDVQRTEDREIPGSSGGSISLRLYFPHGCTQQSLPVVVFFHGGGFVFCDIDSHDGFCREMAKETHSIVVSVGYRRAPEHPAPAAADDAYTALAWVAENAVTFGGDSRRVITAGDSSGGNLATIVCLISNDSGGPELAGQVLLYPMLDPSCDTESYERYATGYFNTKAAMQWYWRQYLHEDAPPCPEHHVAPLRAPSLTGTPQAVLVTAGCDPLRDEGERYAKALAQDAVPVTHRQYAGLFHGFLTIASLRASQSARALLWRDMRTLIGTTHPQQGEG